MKGNKKFILMIAMVVLAIMVAACALADEKLYTSDPFKIPADRVVTEEETEPAAPEAEQSETEESGEQPAETGEQPESEQPGETAEQLEGEKPGETEEQPEDEQPGETEEQPEGEKPEETGEQPEGEKPEETGETPEGELPEEPGETEEQPEGEQPGETEGEDVNPEETEEPEAPKEPLPPEERQVYITSSVDGVITEGDAIYLEGHLVGFDGLEVIYRWQCDKNDGQGWQDVGTNRPYHVFIATKETVQYNWRLVVDVVE